MNALQSQAHKRFLALEHAALLEEDWHRQRIPQPDDLAIATEAREVLWTHIQQLAPRDRLIITLRYYADAQLPEIASTLGLREGAVRVALHRALARLRMSVEDPRDIACRAQEEE
jgi:RNA polymerase sigma factor (sigma-70 family)